MKNECMNNMYSLMRSEWVNCNTHVSLLPEIGGSHASFCPRQNKHAGADSFSSIDRFDGGHARNPPVWIGASDASQSIGLCELENMLGCANIDCLQRLCDCTWKTYSLSKDIQSTEHMCRSTLTCKSGATVVVGTRYEAMRKYPQRNGWQALGPK